MKNIFYKENFIIRLTSREVHHYDYHYFLLKRISPTHKPVSIDKSMPLAVGKMCLFETLICFPFLRVMV